MGCYSLHPHWPYLFTHSSTIFYNPQKRVHYSGKLSFVETEHEVKKKLQKNVDFNQGFPQKLQFRCSSHTYHVISRNFTNFPLFWPLCYYLTNLPPASFAFAIWKCILCLGDYVFSNLLVTLFTKHFNDISLYILQKHTTIIFSSFIYWRYIIILGPVGRLYWKIKIRHLS